MQILGWKTCQRRRQVRPEKSLAPGGDLHQEAWSQKNHDRRTRRMRGRPIQKGASGKTPASLPRLASMRTEENWDNRHSHQDDVGRRELEKSQTHRNPLIRAHQANNCRKTSKNSKYHPAVILLSR